MAGVSPELALTESVRAVSANQVEVRMIMTQSEYNDFKRAQDILCQKRKKQVSLKNTLHHVNLEFLKKEDPVVRAVRSQAMATKKQKVKEAKTLGTCRVGHKTEANIQSSDIKPKLKNLNDRKPIPAIIFHQVQIRDRGSCQETLPTGEKCLETKWVDLHHIKPVNQGGENSLENLITLCRGHHQLEHWW